MSAIKTKAIGQEKRGPLTDFFSFGSELPQKKYRPPRPMDVKGGCSPENNRRNFDASKRAYGWWQQVFA